jgi:uncharacterized protein YndB with AHSA1/START domain
MSPTDTAAPTTQVYRIYIRATPEAVWDAITKPEYFGKYGYGGILEADFRPGGAMKVRASQEFLDVGAPDVIVDGEIVEADPPRRLVQTWRMLMDPDMAEEGFTRLTHEIAEVPHAGVRLTVTHELEHAPKLAALVAGQSEDTGAGGGWAWVLSDLKSLLETGERIAAS